MGLQQSFLLFYSVFTFIAHYDVDCRRDGTFLLLFRKMTSFFKKFFIILSCMLYLYNFPSLQLLLCLFPPKLLGSFSLAVNVKRIWICKCNIMSLSSFSVTWVCVLLYLGIGWPIRGFHPWRGLFFLSDISIVAYDSSSRGEALWDFPHFTLACLLVLLLGRSWLGCHVVEITWVQFPCNT